MTKTLAVNKSVTTATAIRTRSLPIITPPLRSGVDTEQRMNSLRYLKTGACRGVRLFRICP
jgi:hypothetical protein